MKIKSLLLPVVALCMAASSQAAVLASYQFTSAAVTATTALTGVTAGDYSFSSTSDEGAVGIDGGFSGSGNAFNRSDTTGATVANALADDDFFSVTISATSPGTTLDLSTLTLNLFAQGSNAGAFSTNIHLQTSVGGFGTGNATITGINTSASFTGIGTSGASATSFDLSAPAFNALTSITFQFRFSDSLDDNGKLARFDDVVLNGTVIPEPSSALLGGLGMLLLLRRRR